MYYANSLVYLQGVNERRMNKREDLITSIIKRRTELGMSRYRLSAITGLTEFNLMNIEKGNGFNVDSLIKICNALGLTITITSNEESFYQDPILRALEGAE